MTMGRRTSQEERDPRATGAIALLLLPGSSLRAPAADARARRELRSTQVVLLRLEDSEQHGLAFFQLEGERWLSRSATGPPSRTARRARPHPGRLKTAAPQALTTTPATASAQKGRVSWRRPRDSSTIK